MPFASGNLIVDTTRPEYVGGGKQSWGGYWLEKKWNNFDFGILYNKYIKHFPVREYKFFFESHYEKKKTLYIHYYSLLEKF